ncbi:MAG: dipeptidase [Candidatus Abyssubacteria bacterium]
MRQKKRAAAVRGLSKATVLQNDLFICDAHVDTLSKMLQFGWSSLAQIPRSSHVTAARLRASGVGAVVLALFTEKNERPLSPQLRTLKMIDLAYSMVHENRDWLELATNAEAILCARRQGRIAVMLAIENGIAIGNDLANLRNFHRLGVRLLGLTWNHRNLLGDGVGRSGGRRGLTAFGREVLREMRRLGMIVDVSHLSERTFWQVMETAEGRIVATHSNARSICASPRNLTDEQIKALSERGGFIGLNFCSAFLSNSGEATIDDVVRHATHIAHVGGVKVLGIGSDFDGIANPPKGLEHIGKMGALVKAFRKAGFSNNDIRSIAHGNFLRILM